MRRRWEAGPRPEQSVRKRRARSMRPASPPTHNGCVELGVGTDRRPQPHAYTRAARARGKRGRDAEFKEAGRFVPIGRAADVSAGRREVVWAVLLCGAAALPSVARADIDACALLTPGEIGGAVGVPVTAGSHV